MRRTPLTTIYATLSTGEGRVDHRVCLSVCLSVSLCVSVCVRSVAGQELLERIISDDYMLTERECVHFMRQICQAVAYMHLRQVVHLDLKPDNVLCVTPNGNEVKIIDFGLARKLDPASKPVKVL